MHDAEGWDAALCTGERGDRWARFGEWLRRGADLEHWAAFPRPRAEPPEGPVDPPGATPVVGGEGAADVDHLRLRDARGEAGRARRAVFGLTTPRRQSGARVMPLARSSVQLPDGCIACVRNIATGQCLASGGGRLTMRGCDSSREVSWLVGRGGGGLTFKNQASGTCLHDSSIGLRLFACNQLNFQAWQ